MKEQQLFKFLEKQNIPYDLFEHQQVFTVEEEPIVTSINGVKTTGTMPTPGFKTLFLKDKKNNFALVSVIESKRVDLKALSSTLKYERFSFGKPEKLLELLNVIPGSVCQYGLMFDTDNQVPFFLDQDALKLEYVCFHPLRNDMTIAVKPNDFLRCMTAMHHEATIIQIPIK